MCPVQPLPVNSWNGRMAKGSLQNERIEHMPQGDEQGYDRQEEFRLEEDLLEGVVNSIDATIDYREDRTVYAADRKSADIVKGLRDTETGQLRNIRNRPYFGRVDYLPSGDDGRQTFYVGDVNVLHDNPTFRVISRNAPAARLYYVPTEGSYEVKDKRTNKVNVIKALVHRKRTLTIEDARLKDIDDVLRLPSPATQLQLESSRTLDQKLAAAKGDYMEDAAQTIQPDQYKQIAATLKPVLIVQGSAGSGKSLVGLRRLEFILSPFSYIGNLSRPREDKVIMFGPSPAFLKYVSGLLPGIGIERVRQTTVAQWMLGQFSSRVTRSTSDSLFLDLMSNRRKLTEEEIEAHAFKTGLGMKRVLDNFAASLSRDVKDRVLSVGEITLAVYPLWRLSAAEFKTRVDDAFRTYRAPNRAREGFINRIVDERARFQPLRGRTPGEQRDYYRRLVVEGLDCWPRIDFRKEYVELLKSSDKVFKYARKGDIIIDEAEEIAKTARRLSEAGQALGITDLAPALYLDFLINGFTSEGFEHVVVDEAQDISPLEIALMQMHSYNNTFTILGDLRQSVIPYKSIANWNQIASLFERGSVDRLESRLTYRSTQQITQYANRILQSLPRRTGMPIPYKRKGERPRLVRSGSATEMRSAIIESVSDLLKHTNVESVAVLTKWRQTAEDITRAMEERGMKNVGLLTAEGTVEASITVGSIILTKGLEFDAVVVANVGKNNFNETDFDRMLLYLACTRARHRLEIHWYGTRSPIVPEVTRLRI